MRTESIDINEDQYFTIHEENGMFAICLRDKTVKDCVLAGDAVFDSMESAKAALTSVIHLKENVPTIDLCDIYGMPNHEHTIQ